MCLLPQDVCAARKVQNRYIHTCEVSKHTHAMHQFNFIRVDILYRVTIGILKVNSVTHEGHVASVRIGRARAVDDDETSEYIASETAH